MLVLKAYASVQKFSSQCKIAPDVPDFLYVYMHAPLFSKKSNKSKLIDSSDKFIYMSLVVNGA